MVLPDGIEQLNIQSGRISIRAAPSAVARGIMISNGNMRLPLEPLATGDVNQLPFHMVFPLAETGLLKKATMVSGDNGIEPGTLCEARINALPDWTLDNSQTVQLRLHERMLPGEFEFAAQAVLPPHQRSYTFQAALGAHRADAELILTVTSLKTGKNKRFSALFDKRKRGGMAQASYQVVQIQIPPMDDDTTVTMSVAYRGYRQEHEDNDPYLFIANPEITTQHGPKSVLLALSFSGAPTSDGAWYHAMVPPHLLDSDHPILLMVGSISFPIFTPQKDTIKVSDDDGHTLTMQIGQIDRYVFFIDGVPGFAAQIGPNPTPIRFPTKYLDGQYHHVTVRDSTGTQILWENYVILPRLITPLEIIQRETRAPFPTSLSTQSAHRYAALKTHLSRPDKHNSQIAHVLSVLEGGYDNVRLDPLRFPKVAKPDVSIIIPAHNKVQVTYYALCALLLAHNEASFEVIVVDDASSDETARLKKFVSGITVIHNKKPQRFIRACNAGVAQARGKYVVLLNNDTEPTAGWLDALIDTFSRFDNVGLAGAKLLYPDGRLQDGGGIIWGSGNPWNYGNGQNPWDTRFTYARQADYLSGAALMTTRKIWDQVGGFSSYLEPMYFEDTDLSFKVREAGYTTWFVPSSVVYHFEGMTSGTDVSSGFKRYQEVNRPKFKRRWARAFDPFGAEGVAPDLEKDRGIVGRVLFIDYSTPRPDMDAGSYAAIQEIRLVQSLGYKVTLLPQNLAHLGHYTEALERNGVEVIVAPFSLSTDEFLHSRGAEFDAVYITRYYVGQDTIDTIREVAPQAKILFNNADLHFLRELRAGLAHNDADRIALAREVRDEELAVMRKADVVLSYNEVEHSVIQSHTDGAVKVLTCPWVVDSPKTAPGLKNRSGLSFLGSFRHHPNSEGVKWFAQTVMPQLAVSHPGLQLSIYGADMTDEVRALETDNIDPVGFVENIADAYDRHLVFVAPLLSGAGIKGKVLAALAHGVPCVLTPMAAEGIGLRHGHDCMIAETPADWVDAITALHNDPKFWQNMSKTARSYVADRFSFARGREKMRAVFEAVDLFGAVR